MCMCVCTHVYALVQTPGTQATSFFPSFLRTSFLSTGFLLPLPLFFPLHLHSSLSHAGSEAGDLTGGKTKYCFFVTLNSFPALQPSAPSTPYLAKSYSHILLQWFGIISQCVVRRILVPAMPCHFWIRIRWQPRKRRPIQSNLPGSQPLLDHSAAGSASLFTPHSCFPLHYNSEQITLGSQARAWRTVWRPLLLFLL